MEFKKYYIVAKTKEEKEKAFEKLKGMGYNHYENGRVSDILCADRNGDFFYSSLSEDYHKAGGYEKLTLDEKKVEYMVMVKGRGAPSKRHASLEEARLEAERLAKLEGKSALILRIDGEVAIEYKTSLYY